MEILQKGVLHLETPTEVKQELISEELIKIAYEEINCNHKLAKAKANLAKEDAVSLPLVAEVHLWNQNLLKLGAARSRLLEELRDIVTKGA